MSVFCPKCTRLTYNEYNCDYCQYQIKKTNFPKKSLHSKIYLNIRNKYRKINTNFSFKKKYLLIVPVILIIGIAINLFNKTDKNKKFLIKYNNTLNNSIVKEEVPVIKEEIPVIKEEVPVIKEEVPVIKEEVPVIKKEIPVIKEEIENNYIIGDMKEDYQKYIDNLEKEKLNKPEENYIIDDMKEDYQKYINSLEEEEVDENYIINDMKDDYQEYIYNLEKDKVS